MLGFDAHLDSGQMNCVGHASQARLGSRECDALGHAQGFDRLDQCVVVACVVHDEG